LHGRKKGNPEPVGIPPKSSDIRKRILSTLYFAASQASCTNVHLLAATLGLDANSLDVRFPHSVGSSMGMADIIAKVNSLFANSTLSHDYTSLNHT
jgi:hypothetical protein